MKRRQVSGFSPRVSLAFTLVEVLVALAIFAVAAVMLAASYVNVLVGYQTMRGRASEQSDLAFVRSTLLNEPQRDVAEKGGEMRSADGAVRWQVKIDPTKRADLFRVTIAYEIAPAGTAPARHREESFLLLRPTWSDPAERDKLREEFRQELLKRNSATSS